jgi:hypothetical protein
MVRYDHALFRSLHLCFALLFVDNNHEAKEFRAHIVQYNSALAFTSLGVNIDHSIDGGGPPVFQIHGELKHSFCSLLPEPSQNPTYSQLYIYDPLSAYRFRVTRNPNLALPTMSTLQDVICHHNPYSKIYQHAYEILQRYDAPDYTMKLCVVPGNDPSRYNLPTVDEVAVVLPGGDTFQCDYRDIIVHLCPQYIDIDITDMGTLN